MALHNLVKKRISLPFGSNSSLIKNINGLLTIKSFELGSLSLKHSRITSSSVTE